MHRRLSMTRDSVGLANNDDTLSSPAAGERQNIAVKELDKVVPLSTSKQVSHLRWRRKVNAGEHLSS